MTCEVAALAPNLQPDMAREALELYLLAVPPSTGLAVAWVAQALGLTAAVPSTMTMMRPLATQTLTRCSSTRPMLAISGPINLQDSSECVPSGL